jgi:hypothetical protein
LDGRGFGIDEGFVRKGRLSYFVAGSSLWKKCVSVNSEAEMQTRKNFKFGSSLRFGPVKQRQNTFFPETHFFPKTGDVLQRNRLSHPT